MPISSATQHGASARTRTATTENGASRRDCCSSSFARPMHQNSPFWSLSSLVLLIVLVGWVLLPVLAERREQREVVRLQQQLEELKVRNEQWREEIEQGSSTPVGIEWYPGEPLRYVKPGERAYVVATPRIPAKSAPDRTSPWTILFDRVFGEGRWPRIWCGRRARS